LPAAAFIERLSLSEDDTIAFIDLEASGLGPQSWPIEVGWCLPEGAAHAFLIRPDDEWPRDQWDDQAEALHGIAYRELEKSGAPVRDVCNWLNKALGGKTVYSDAPDWDGFWLLRLFQAGDVRQQFALFDFGAFLRKLAGVEVRKISDRANAVHPHRHRASDDVRHMRAVYELALSAAENR